MSFWECGNEACSQGSRLTPEHKALDNVAGRSRPSKLQARRVDDGLLCSLSDSPETACNGVKRETMFLQERGLQERALSLSAVQVFILFFYVFGRSDFLWWLMLINTRMPTINNGNNNTFIRVQMGVPTTHFLFNQQALACFFAALFPNTTDCLIHICADRSNAILCWLWPDTKH